MVRRVDGCSVPDFPHFPKQSRDGYLPSRFKVCELLQPSRDGYPGQVTTLFPQQPGQKVATPRVERVSMKYISSSVHPTSGLDEFP